MSKVYYHNVTRNILNITDVMDFLDEYQEGDKLYCTVSGDATLAEITTAKFREMVEYWAENTLEDFKEIVNNEVKKLWLY